MFRPHKRTANTTALWHFDGNANDSSGNGHNGTVSGATLDNGRLGQSYLFDTTSEYIDFGGNVNWGNQSSMAFWIKFSSFNTTYGDFIWQKREPGSNNGTWQISLDTSQQMYFYCYDGVGWKKKATSGVSLSTNIWYHFIFVADIVNTGNSAIYLDGRAQTLAFDETSSVFGSNTSTLRLGYCSNSGTNYTFQGNVDDTIIENRLWSPAEAKAIYNQGMIIH